MSAAADAIPKIYDAIVEQLLPPGTKLGEESLCEIFGVSRTLIRRVLQRLASEHMVESRPPRGAFVARPSVEEAREVLEERRALETHVIHRLADELTLADAERLRRHTAKEWHAQAASDQHPLISRSGEFHLMLAELAGNRAIARFLRELIARTSLIMRSTKRRGNPVARSTNTRRSSRRWRGGGRSSQIRRCAPICWASSSASGSIGCRSAGSTCATCSQPGGAPPRAAPRAHLSNRAGRGVERTLARLIAPRRAGSAIGSARACASRSSTQTSPRA